MKIEYVGNAKNHGWHGMADAPAAIRWNDGQVRRDSVLADSADDRGLKLWFRGAANMNRKSEYQIVLHISDQELIELFQGRFGLTASPLSLAGDRAKAEMERRLLEASGSPVPRRLPAPNQDDDIFGIVPGPGAP
ncbi:hypothetical protein [Falsiroseomonas ponticola]|uniref:hypothetical protein n=1 Tax=Falsiroseomonas ponticola TaxID=2786951 RepID=UPI00193167EA|nr:hypothetical protein [Roseomonas ponticola]